ncbi:hypothetical protein MLD38_036358 [Melastoma candidum]|uniref:Uncharacterized protein n=1 Tax=Melastoma candidum TaxID=119954 RepID=A0ACB9LLA6_9MYRT|nr:hypothetical protein MLD38_036358 [Melastoma candidum]
MIVNTKALVAIRMFDHNPEESFVVVVVLRRGWRSEQFEIVTLSRSTSPTSEASCNEAEVAFSRFRPCRWPSCFDRRLLRLPPAVTMKGRNPCIYYRQIRSGRGDRGHDNVHTQPNDNVNTEPSDDRNGESSAISMDLILSNDILECILARLPIAGILRMSSVCKRWNVIVKSSNFRLCSSRSTPQIPWYFMFTSSDNRSGHAFDPTLRKWYSIELPGIERSNWLVASSNGLVAFMDNDRGSKLSVCNPITRRCRKLEQPPGSESSDYCTLALSAGGTRSQNYTVSVVKSKQVQGNFFQWDLSIHLYHTDSMKWVSPLEEIVTGWRGGNESVICDRTLYFLIYAIGGGCGLARRHRHALVAYTLAKGSSRGQLDENMIPVPCLLTCGRLINLKEKLVLVGGIGRQGRGDMIIKGIGIWALNEGKDGWVEITRMPNRLFRGCGGFDEVFASGGTDGVVYVHSYGSPTLLMFDVESERWELTPKCPATKKFPLQLFEGFCFEPCLGIAP